MRLVKRIIAGGHTAKVHRQPTPENFGRDDVDTLYGSCRQKFVPFFDAVVRGLATAVSAVSMIRGSNMCNYNPTNRAPIPEKGPRRNFDTGPTQDKLRQRDRDFVTRTIVRVGRYLSHSRCKADEAWLYYYDPTIKQQSSEWKHPSSPTPKKAKTVKSAGKAMTITFFIMKELCINTLSNPVLP
ncbi:hypothetical protein TNCV_4291341 [Trichonephila clavipes]|nr:hypothetical protein TNCV_4291341 [Trichonephila clavipes]